MGCVLCIRKKTLTTRVNSVSFNQNLFENLASKPLSHVSSSPSTSRGAVDQQRRFNLESHQIVWLDIDQKLNVSVETLRNLVDYSTIFNDEDKCQLFLESTKGSTTFLVLCSRSTTPDLETRIQQSKNIRAVYRYCSTKTISDIKYQVKVRLSGSL